MADSRNDSRVDAFLDLIRRSERGRLKIYLGYAAGVGKTWQMLQEARRLRERGVDVVAGYVEMHGRKETETLLEGLDVIPVRKVPYKGIELPEMDLDAVIARHPEVVLVDELAHTNAPGCRNEKRFQDVEAILEKGISVISTLNVQHLESLYETVEKATGIRVQERIPDRIVTTADQLVNVDITAVDLQQRLREGKIYPLERVEHSLKNFFQEDKLENLRELTLREIAAQLDSRQREECVGGGVFCLDQVMVCLSSRGPRSAVLLHAASRLAGRLNRNWYAVYVQTKKEAPGAVDAATQRSLANTLALARNLGAQVFICRGQDVVRAILHFAREYRVGYIVIGMPEKPLPLWKRFCGRIGVVERLALESSGVTIMAVDTKGTPPAPVPAGEDFEIAKLS